MKTVPLNEPFYVEYGSKFDLNKMERLAKVEGGINFVNRSSKNCGVSATVARVSGVEPYSAGKITVFGDRKAAYRGDCGESQNTCRGARA